MRTCTSKRVRAGGVPVPHVTRNGVPCVAVAGASTGTENVPTSEGCWGSAYRNEPAYAAAVENTEPTACGPDWTIGGRDRTECALGPSNSQLSCEPNLATTVGSTNPPS